MKYSLSLLSFIMLVVPATVFAQQIKIEHDRANNKLIITAGNRPFTEFIYPDSMEKPVLYPIYAADGALITRGYPVAPRPNEPIDHPHHIGLWMNYESVNGLDFWHNSFAIPADKKPQYGWIKTKAVTGIKNGSTGSFTYEANWQNIHAETLLKERTTFYFSQKNNVRIIDRVSTLTAATDVMMKDVKDGFLGLRVAHELELPSKEAREFTDEKGNVTKVNKSSNDVTGNYLTSKGYTGDAAWGTRGEWCMLYGKMGEDSVAVIIIDHPSNVGYPTYWHARGYGLFAANPLGQAIFSNGKEQLNFSLKKDQAVTFKFRIVIVSGKKVLSTEEINQLAKDFAAK